MTVSQTFDSFSSAFLIRTPSSDSSFSANSSTTRSFFFTSFAPFASSPLSLSFSVSLSSDFAPFLELELDLDLGLDLGFGLDVDVDVDFVLGFDSGSTVGFDFGFTAEWFSKSEEGFDVESELELELELEPALVAFSVTASLSIKIFLSDLAGLTI